MDDNEREKSQGYYYCWSEIIFENTSEKKKICIFFPLLFLACVLILKAWFWMIMEMTVGCFAAVRNKRKEEKNMKIHGITTSHPCLLKFIIYSCCTYRCCHRVRWRIKWFIDLRCCWIYWEVKRRNFLSIMYLVDSF